jgi:hypothetical protein
LQILLDELQAFTLKTKNEDVALYRRKGKKINELEIDLNHP